MNKALFLSCAIKDKRGCWQAVAMGLSKVSHWSTLFLLGCIKIWLLTTQLPHYTVSSVRAGLGCGLGGRMAE